jgi:mono/diheme cytochrome c family protein
MGKILLGIILGVILTPLAVLAWFHWGNPPVAVADPPFPYERQITHDPLNLRIDREMPKAPLIEAGEANFVAGAEIYRDHCADCHGFYGKPSPFAAHMYPSAPGLWQKHRNSEVVGVSDDPPGETYWKVFNGIRLTGMPAFNQLLSTTQIWQVSLLLANADKPLPPAAVAIVKNEPPPAPQAAPAQKQSAPAHR